MEAKTNLTLHALTGLQPDHLAKVFAENPRAYMAVKGAVAEEHLVLHLRKLEEEGKILSFQRGQNDNEKDFYVYVGGRSLPVTIECKNVEVIKVNGQAGMRAYLEYLVRTNRIEAHKETLASLNGQGLELLFKKIPQWLRESGLPRYEYSASKLANRSHGGGDAKKFLSQFDENPVTIDFQKTRNSQGEDSKTDPKARRFYAANDFDVVAACMFSRSLQWEFVFAASRDLPCHPKFQDRVHNRIVVSGECWSADLLSTFKRVKQRK